MLNTGNGRLRLLMGGSQTALTLPPASPPAAKSPRPLVFFPPAANDQRRHAPAFAGFDNGARSVPVPAPLLGELLAEITDEAELKCVAHAFAGFDNGARSVPVPAPLLGELLTEITDEAELKCALRFLWHQAQVPGSPKRVPAERLLSDGVLLAALGSPERVARGIRLAVERGLLLEADGWLLLNTPRNRQAAGTPARAPYETAAPGAAAPPTIFALYEENIGALTPMIADELRDAEKEYPVGWVEDAIREAASSNARSWRYIAAVLERWRKVGKGTKAHGKSGRHTEPLTEEQILERLRCA